MIRNIYIFIFFIFTISAIGGLIATKKISPSDPIEASVETKVIQTSEQIGSSDSRTKALTWGMKAIDSNITDEDLHSLESLNISILSSEWGMDTLSSENMLLFLDRVQDHNMKFIINFAGVSAWGKSEPIWKKKKVENYLRTIYNHPAVYGYDISNEAGENLPNGDIYRITIKQLEEARDTIRSIDNVKPIIMRMHYWDEEVGSFDQRNPFEEDIANIVMLNLYSNYTINGETVWSPNLVEDSGQPLVNKIMSVDSNAEIWLALAAFEENSFLEPTTKDLKRDIEAAIQITNITNISFFAWGKDSKYDWYLPKDGVNLLNTIKEYTVEVN